MTEFIAVKPEDSFDHWHHVTCRQFSLTECQSSAEHGFTARVSIRQFGALDLVNIWSSTRQDEPILVTRRQADIRKDQRDCFMFWRMIAGTADLVQNGRHAKLQAGDLVLQDQARPFDLKFGQLSHAEVITIPRPLLETRSPQVEKIAGQKISGQSRMAPMAGSIVQQVFGLKMATDAALDRRLGASVLDIVATALDADLDGSCATDRAQRRLNEVKDYMLAHVHDSDLDIEAIAQDRSMGIRTLYRLFALEATTPIQWLWDQRLKTAYRLLTDGSFAQVTDVSLRCGFKDVSHFSKAFRSQFGVSPSSLRLGRAGQPAYLLAPDPRTDRH
jgi:AraC-like DNA-binding protein